MQRGLGFLALLLSLWIATPARAQENFLVLVADDVGVDRVSAYPDHPRPGSTPNIDALAQRGVLFRSAYAYPLCSPTRAALLTGRYGFRTGIGQAIRTDPYGLALDEFLLPEALAAGSGGAYSAVALGKWHLAADGQGFHHPLQSGFAHHFGSFRSLNETTDYYNWIKLIDGSPTTSLTYATSDTTNDAIRMLRTLPEPWLLYVCYNAAHAPLHSPPPGLHGYSLSGNPRDTPIQHHKAMVQALDSEIGRLLSAFSDDLLARTTIAFVGDNGTPTEVVEPPFQADHAKGTLYEGGIHIPLIVANSRVAQPGSHCHALVSVADLFATIVELAGIDLAQVLPDNRAIDAVSLVPYLAQPDRPALRSSLLSERFTPNGFGPYTSVRRALRDERYKLIRRNQASGAVIEEFYDLTLDPAEQHDLVLSGMNLEQSYAYNRLVRELEEILGS